MDRDEQPQQPHDVLRGCKGEAGPPHHVRVPQPAHQRGLALHHRAGFVPAEPCRLEPLDLVGVRARARVWARVRAGVRVRVSLEPLDRDGAAAPARGEDDAEGALAQGRAEHHLGARYPQRPRD
eukprot:scaffold67318_cov48-Phaeocystis_antarctica.AAC.2